MAPPHRCLRAALLLVPCGLSAAVRQGVHRAEFPPFAAFVQRYGRTYELGSAEWEERRGIYEAHVSEASHHNSQASRRWSAGLNEFWDWTAAEQLALRGWRRSARPAGSDGQGSVSSAARANFLESSSLPREKNWTHLRALRGVRQQGGCGSCWAIASATTLEANSEIHTDMGRTFSPQQLVSCVANPQQCGGEGGCKGATVELAMAWVMKHGCAEEYQVPYASVDGHCAPSPAAPQEAAVLAKANGSDVAMAFGMSGWERLAENKYWPLMHALVERGPVAVSAAARSWLTYGGGVFDGCSKDAIIDHAVVLVGYGVDSRTKDAFFLLQNSWGHGWGEAGRIRILRHTSDTAWCGTDDQPELGTGCKGGPPKVTVCGMCGVLYDSVVPYFTKPLAS